MLRSFVIGLVAGQRGITPLAWIVSVAIIAAIFALTIARGVGRLA